MNYEKLYKALCYLLDRAFTEDGYCYSGFDEDDRDILCYLIQYDYDVDDEKDRYDYRSCFYQVMAKMDEDEYLKRKSKEEKEEEETNGR